MRLPNLIAACRRHHFLRNKERDPRRLGKRCGMEICVDHIRRDHAEDIVRRNPARGFSEQVLECQAGVCQHIGSDNVPAVDRDRSRIGTQAILHKLNVPLQYQLISAAERTR